MKSFQKFFFGLLLLLLQSSVVYAKLPTDSLKLHLSEDAGITSSGDSVSIWADQSGKGNDAFQTTIARRPVLVSNSMNEEPVINFNGDAGEEEYLRTSPVRIDMTTSGKTMTFDAAASEPGFTFVNWGYDSNTSRAYHNLPSNPATITINSGTFDVISFDVFEFSGGQTFQVESNLGDTQTFTDTGNKTVTLNWTGISTLTFTRLIGSGAGFDMDNLGFEVNTPTVQASNLTTSNLTSTSVQLDLTAGNGANRLIIAKSGSAVDYDPVDGNGYTSNAIFGSSSELGTGNYAVYVGSGASVTITGLSAENTYHFYAVEYNGGSGNEAYLLTNPVRVDVTTLPAPPTVQVSNLSISEVSSNSLKVSLTAGNGEKRLIVAKKGSAVDFEPVEGNTYTSSSDFGTSSELGIGNYAVYAGADTTIVVTGLSEDSTYHFYAVEYNGAVGEEVYLRTNPARNQVRIPVIPGTNLKLHLRADAGVSASGTEVTGWTDQSVNGNNATQASATNRPVLVANAINGEPAIRFNGIDDYIILPSATDLGIVNNDYQIFIVAKTASATSGSVYFLMASASEVEQYEIHTNGPQGVRYIPDTGIYIDEGTNGDYTDSEVHLFQAEATSTYGLVRMDGDGVTQTNSDSRSEYAGDLILGTRTGGGFWWNGDIAEVIIYNTVLSKSDRNTVEDYLKVKYNIDPPAETPTAQTSNLSISEVTNSSMNISLTPGDGEKRLIIAKSLSVVDETPADSTTYTGNSIFGSGSELGSGNYIVYNGTGSEVTVTGLTQNTLYHFTAFEYNGDAPEERYLTTSAPTASDTTNFTPLSIESQSFEESGASSAVFTAIVETAITTNYQILWGTSSSVVTDSTEISGGTGASADTVSYEITGLSDNTAYYARVRAISSEESVLSDPVPLFFNNTLIPSDSLSLWLSADAGIPDVGNGESVSLWHDLSGKGNNASQDNASLRPILNTNGINGKSVVNFNGSSSTLTVTNSLSLTNTDYEIFVVSRTSGSNDEYVLSNQGGNNYPNLGYYGYDYGVQYLANYSNGDAVLYAGSEGAYTDNEARVFNAYATNSEGQLKVNYITESTDKTKSFWNDLTGTWYIGSFLGSHSYLSGDIAELIIYDRKLTDLERFSVHQYLSDKYNLELPLSTPTEQVSNLEFEKTGPTSAKLSFSPGNGTYNLALIKSGSVVDALPVDSTTYTASSAFGSGTEIGTGNFVVGSTSDSSITITGLTPETTYYASLISLNGDAGFEKYLTTNPDTASLYFPPSVVLSSVTPSAFSLDNETTTTIQVTFSDAMNTSTFDSDSSFTVRGSESGLHTGVFQFSGGNTVVTFTPDSAFKPGEIISVGLTNKLKGDAKNFEDHRTYLFQIKTSRSSATFEKSASLDQSFSSKKTIVSDMNNDGLNDIIMLNRSSYSISIRFADSDSTFSEPDDFSAGDGPTDFALADIDGDGDEDILVTDDDSSVLKVMYNDGDGEFDTSTNYSLNENSYSVTSGDLDHDGDLDVVVGMYQNISVLINDGTGTLSSPTDYSTNESEDVTELAAVDIDGDGDTDILGSDDYESFYMLKNNGDGTFESPLVLDTFDNPFDLVYGDIDGDGDVDAVLSSDDDSYLYVYKNNGNGTFASRVAYETDDYGQFLSLNDIDGDGDLDILAGEEDDNYMHIYLNPGAGTFPSYTTFQLKYSMNSFTMSDLDMDGDLDLIAATYDSLFIYKNINFDPLTITGSEGWRLMASPAGKIQYSTILDNLWTQGASGADTESGTSNVYYWPVTSSSISDTNWTAVTNMSDSLQSGFGMLMYIFSDDNGPATGDTGFPKEVIFPGSIPQAGQNLSALLNQNTSGWTLLGNPFYQQIDWDNINRTDLTNSVYVYDVNAAGWKSWNGSLGSLTDGLIDIYDAFFVQSTSDDAYLQIPYPNGGSGGDAKIIKNETFFFSLEIVSDSSFRNKAWFQFSESGEFGIDNFDAYKLGSLSSKYVSLASVLNDSVRLDINSLPLITEILEIPLELHSTETGSHSFSLKDVNFPEEWEVELYDRELKTSIMLKEDYTFTLSSNKVIKAKEQNLPSLPSLAHVLSGSKLKAASTRFSLRITPSSVVSNQPLIDLPTSVELKQNYPNPFNPSTTIAYGLPESGKVTLEVFDILGRKVATLLNGETKTAGRYSVNFNASNLASGMYIYRLRAGNVVMIKKLTLIK